jgi:hypothetical protein
MSKLLYITTNKNIGWLISRIIYYCLMIIIIPLGLLFPSSMISLLDELLNSYFKISHLIGKSTEQRNLEIFATLYNKSFSPKQL